MVNLFNKIGEFSLYKMINKFQTKINRKKKNRGYCLL